LIHEKNRNDLRKVLEESDDSLGEVETTKKIPSTTTTTTTSTTTTTKPPTTKSTTTTVATTKSTTSSTSRSTKRYYAPSKSYFSNSFYNNNQNNQINGQSGGSKGPALKTVTTNADTETSSTSTTTTNSPAKSTINPFYYGFNRLPKSNKNTNTYFTTKAQTPYKFQYFSTTSKQDLLASSSTKSSISEVENNYHENQSPPSEDIEFQSEKPPKVRQATYNPVFDIYFKQIGRQRTSTPRA
jgi:hypothetical protein